MLAVVCKNLKCKILCKGLAVVTFCGTYECWYLRCVTKMGLLASKPRGLYVQDSEGVRQTENGVLISKRLVEKMLLKKSPQLSPKQQPCCSVPTTDREIEVKCADTAEINAKLSAHDAACR